MSLRFQPGGDQLQLLCMGLPVRTAPISARQQPEDFKRGSSAANDNTNRWTAHQTGLSCVMARWQPCPKATCSLVQGLETHATLSPRCLDAACRQGHLAWEGCGSCPQQRWPVCITLGCCMLSSIRTVCRASSLWEAKVPELCLCQKLRRQLACCAAGLLQPWLTPAIRALVLKDARASLVLRRNHFAFKFERLGRYGTCAATMTNCLEGAHLAEDAHLQRGSLAVRHAPAAITVDCGPVCSTAAPLGASQPQHDAACASRGDWEQVLAATLLGTESWSRWLAGWPRLLRWMMAAAALGPGIPMTAMGATQMTAMQTRRACSDM